MFWFFVAVIFFILWITKKAKPSERDRLFKTGYSAGYEALRKRLAEVLSRKKIDDPELHDLSGTAPQIAPTPVTPATSVAQPVAPGYLQAQPVEHELPAAPVDQPEAPVAAILTMASAKPALSDHERSIRNLNVILYLASFLLVAAAAALIAASMPSSIKLGGLIAVVILFYGAGMILHRRAPVMRPAAVAFIGTGLAILPFVGIALTTLAGVSGSASWLTISIIGTIAYYVAALTLQSQIISYLTVAFTLSLASSFVSVAPVGFVWYFVVLIVVSLLASTIAQYRPHWIPSLFAKPIEATGQLVTPIALVASLVTFQSMTLHLYELVFTTATLHYLVVLAQQRIRLYETVSRVAVHVTLLIYVADLFGLHSDGGALAWLVLAVLQTVYSLVRVRILDTQSRVTESSFIAVALLLSVVGLACWSFQSLGTHMIINWSVFSAIGIAAAIRLRNANWSYPAVFGSLLILPDLYTNIAHVSEPAPWLALSFITLAALVCAALAFVHEELDRSARVLSYVTFGLWAFVAICYALLDQDPTIIAVTFTIAAVVTAVFSHEVKLPSLEIIAGSLLYFAIIATVEAVETPLAWRALIVGIASAGLLYAGAYVYHRSGMLRRRNYLFSLGNLFGATIILSGISSSHLQLQITYVIFLLATLACLYARTVVTSTHLQKTLLCSYIVYAFLLWVAGLQLGTPWVAIAYLIGAGVFWIGSHIERTPLLTIVGNASVLAAIATVIGQTSLAPNWVLLTTVWSAIVVYGIVYAYYFMKRDTYRSRIAIGSAWTLFAVATCSGVGTESPYNYAAVVTFIVGAGSVVLHGYLTRQAKLIEAGVYLLTLALQWLVRLIVPSLNVVFYAHWWAITIVAVGAYMNKNVLQRVFIGVGIVTFITGGYALTMGGYYSLLFLVEQIIVALTGALKQKQHLLWWGLAGAVLAIMYFLRDYVYLWLGFLGLTLIGIVVWRLRKIARSQSKQ